MLNLTFSDADIEALDYERYHHPHPQVQRKMEVLYLKSQGLRHQQIQQLCRIRSRTTFVSYLRQYKEDGIEALKHLHYKGQPSQLNEHIPSLKAHFEAHPPRTAAEAQAEIERLTGIKRSPTQIKAFLKRIGMQSRKVGYLPGKAATPEKIEEQEAFRVNQLEPRLEAAKAGERAVFFVDAAHFVHRAYLGFVWCFTRIFIPSPSGRKRFNLLGALNAVTQEVITVTNDSYINSTSVCELLLKLAALPSKVPITVVLDNARYQKCRLVMGLANALDIELLFLPAYSPQLNLIERLWKFIRNDCLYSKYYAEFAEFKGAIETCLEQANTTHRPALESLLTLNFQSFKNVQISNV